MTASGVLLTGFDGDRARPVVQSWWPLFNLDSWILLVGVMLTGCAETKFAPPSPEVRQQLGTIGAVTHPAQSSPSIDEQPVSGAGAGALTGAGQAAAVSIAGGAEVGCGGASVLGCVIGLGLGTAVAVVAAPIGAVVGAAKAHPTEEVRLADSNLRSALSELHPSEELRNKVIADARARTAFDFRAEELSPGSAGYSNLKGHGFDSVMEIAVTDLQLNSTGRFDPDVTLVITAEARIYSAESEAELYHRKWTYLANAHRYFDMAAGNASLLREEVQHGFDRLADRIVFDLFINNGPELQTRGRPGEVWTIDAPTLKDSGTSLLEGSMW